MALSSEYTSHAPKIQEDAENRIVGGCQGQVPEIPRGDKPWRKQR